MKKNFQTVVTQVGIGNKNFGVGLIDNNRMIKNFSGLSESDARNAEKFVGGIFAVILEEKILLPIDETAHVVQISDGNYMLNWLAGDDSDVPF